MKHRALQPSYLAVLVYFFPYVFVRFEWCALLGMHSPQRHNYCSLTPSISFLHARKYSNSSIPYVPLSAPPHFSSFSVRPTDQLIHTRMMGENKRMGSNFFTHKNDVLVLSILIAFLQSPSGITFKAAQSHPIWHRPPTSRWHPPEPSLIPPLPW